MDEAGYRRSRAVLFFAVAILPLLPTAFIDSGSEKIVQVTVAPPCGAGSEQVLERAAQAEAILLADPDVDLVATSVPGESDVGFQTVLAAQLGRATNSAQIVVRLDSSRRSRHQDPGPGGEARPVGDDGYDVAVGQQGGGGTNSVSVIVSAADAGRRPDRGGGRGRAGEEPGLANLTSDLVKAAPEVQVRVDPNRAIGVGLTAAQVGAEIRTR